MNWERHALRVITLLSATFLFIGSIALWSEGINAWKGVGILSCCLFVAWFFLQKDDEE